MGVYLFTPRPSPAGGHNTRARDTWGAGEGWVRGAGLPLPGPFGRYPAASSPHTAVSSSVPSAAPPVGSSPDAPQSHQCLPPSPPAPAWYLRSLSPEAAPFQAVRKAMDAGRTWMEARAAPRGSGSGSGGSGGSTWTGWAGRGPWLLPAAAGRRLPAWQGRRCPGSGPGQPEQDH